MLIKISFKYRKREIFHGEGFANGIPARELGGSRTEVVKLMNLYIIIILFRISCIMLQISLIIVKDIKNITYMKSFEVENIDMLIHNLSIKCVKSLALHTIIHSILYYINNFMLNLFFLKSFHV